MTGETKNPKSEVPNPPIISVKGRAVSVALFESQKVPGQKSIVIQKSWRKMDGTYERRSVSFFEEDVPALKQILADFFKQYDEVKKY